VTAEETDAIGRAIALLERATVNEPLEYWQAVLDDIEPLVDLNIVDNVSVAFKFVVAVRDRTDRAHSTQGRAAYIDDATMFLWRARQFPR
jgi:hypothetical protein